MAPKRSTCTTCHARPAEVIDDRTLKPVCAPCWLKKHHREEVMALKWYSDDDDVPTETPVNWNS
jgi:hypothetical protein